MSIEASTSTPVFLGYLEQVLVPALKRTRPDAILVMDNLRPHHATEVGELLARAGIGADVMRRENQPHRIDLAQRAPRRQRLFLEDIQSRPGDDFFIQSPRQLRFF